MANASVSRLGLTQGGSDNDSLFLKVFSGEVLTSYNSSTVMKDRVRVRKISSGKSAQFPAIGQISAQYHTPGNEITGSTVNHGEVVITIDDLLISSAFVANIDEAKNHYEVRAEYSKQMGQALAQTLDRQLLSMAALATKANDLAPAVITEIGGANRKNAGASATASDFRNAVYAAAQQFDEDNIPSEGRFVVVPPAIYYGLLTEGSSQLLDRDFSTSNGDYAAGTLMKVAGFEVIKSNNLALDHTADATQAKFPFPTSKYEIDATNCMGMCLHKDALGVVQLMDMASESQYDMRRQGTLMVSKMAVGCGVLRPESVHGIWKVD